MLFVKKLRFQCDVCLKSHEDISIDSANNFPASTTICMSHNNHINNTYCDCKGHHNTTHHTLKVIRTEILAQLLAFGKCLINDQALLTHVVLDKSKK